MVSIKLSTALLKQHENMFIKISGILQWRQTTFHAEQQNLGSTEYRLKTVKDLQQMYRKEVRMVIDNNFF